MQDQAALQYRGVLRGHRDWVTALTVPPNSPNKIISSSRDKKVIVWEIFSDADEKGDFGRAMISLGGHDQAVQDVVVSSDGQFAMSASWDKTLRLWDIRQAKTLHVFNGHTSDVYSVSFSPDNRQIVSAGRDRTIRLWNTLGECKYTMVEKQHSDWISCVRFSPSSKSPVVVSCGWDKLVKVWNLTDFHLKDTFVGHTGPLNCVTISPDGSLCASGGRDGTTMLWDVKDSRHLYSLDGSSTINGLCFSPVKYWLCSATDKAVKIWDLENKEGIAEIKLEASGDNSMQIVDVSAKNLIGTIAQHPPLSKFIPWATCLQWSSDARFLFVGAANGLIYVFESC